jgi:hypothetical protein
MSVFLRRHLWWLLPAALGLAVLGQIAYTTIWPPTLELHAMWAFRPGSIEEVVQHAELIVRARVVSVEAGEDEVAQLPQEEHRRPTQLVKVQVATAYKGAVGAGTTLSMFQNGGYNPKTRAMEFFGDDPRYQVGQEYILFLRKGVRDLFIVVSPEGRYLLSADQRLQPVTDNRVTRELRDKPILLVEPILRKP